MKLVVNRCYGGFGLSPKAVKRYAEIKRIKLYPFADNAECTGFVSVDWEHKGWRTIHYSTKPLKDGKYEEGSYFLELDIPRDDKALIQVIEELGDEANGFASDLEIVDIPDDVDYTIEEYDGSEWIAEKHRVW